MPSTDQIAPADAALHRVTLPGFGLPPSAGWSRKDTRFPRAFKARGRDKLSRGVTLRELRMLEFVDEITDECEWTHNVYNKKLVREWRDSTYWLIDIIQYVRSAAPPSPPKLPNLKRHQDDTDPADSHEDKAAILSSKFFPSEVSLAPSNAAPSRPLQNISQTVTYEDVAQALALTASWKAPGDDGIPAGFLKAAGPPLIHALTSITKASFKTGHYPRCFRNANVIVLPKPGKTRAEKQFAGAYRPISLLRVTGKSRSPSLRPVLPRRRKSTGSSPKLNSEIARTGLRNLRASQSPK